MLKHSPSGQKHTSSYYKYLATFLHSKYALLTKWDCFFVSVYLPQVVEELKSCVRCNKKLYITPDKASLVKV